MIEGGPKFLAKKQEAGLENAEVIERARKTWKEFHPYIYDKDGKRLHEIDVDSDTNEHLRTLANQLTEDLEKLSWHECMDNDLPWNPRKAANDNMPPTAKAA